MPSLPTPGGSVGAWASGATGLNDYLLAFTNGDATLKTASVAAALSVSMNSDGTLKSPATVAAAALGTNPASAGTIRIPNNSWIASRNAANNADVNMLRVNSSNQIELGTQVYSSFSQPPTNQGAFNALTTFANVTGQANSILNAYASVHGTVNVTTRANGIYLNIGDDASVANRTISASTNATPVEITTSANHGWLTGEKVNIYGASVGALNASWTITVTAVNKFTLDGSTAPGSTTAVGTVTNRPMLYGVAAVVAPTVARGAGPPSALNCDDVNCFVGYNGGTAVATECFYVGRNTGIATPDWGAGYTSDVYAQYGLFKASGRVASGGAAFYGQNATIDSGGYFITAPNDTAWAAKNNSGTVTELFRMNATNRLEIKTGILMTATATYGLDFLTGSYSTAVIRIPNNVAISARDATNSSDVTMIYLDTPNNRVVLRDNRVFIAAGQMVLADSYNIQFNTTTGSKIGTATNEKIAFHGSTAVIQRAGAAQAAVATTAATQTTPWGFSTQAQADAIVTLVNELRAALVEKGLIKGAA